MKDESRRGLIRAVGASVVGLLSPLRMHGEDDRPHRPSNSDIEGQLTDLAGKVSEIDDRLSLAGPIQSQLAATRDAVESIAVQLSRTEPLIASRIQQIQNTIAEMNRGREFLDPNT